MRECELLRECRSAAKFLPHDMCDHSVNMCAVEELIARLDAALAAPDVPAVEYGPIDRTTLMHLATEYSRLVADEDTIHALIRRLARQLLEATETAQDAEGER